MTNRPFNKTYDLSTGGADLDFSDVGGNESLFIVSAYYSNPGAVTQVVTMTKGGKSIEPGKSVGPKATPSSVLAGTILQGGTTVHAAIDGGAMTLDVSGTITAKQG